jgi:glutathione S-transferase
MLLLQFSTSHYCRKARLALGYKQISYIVENLTPGVHAFKLKPMTGNTTVPVLLPQVADQPTVVGDSTEIIKFLETYHPDPPLIPAEPHLSQTVWMLEDWLDESIGVATRFIYYTFRANEGKQIDSSLASQILIRIVRQQYGMTPARVELARERLQTAIAFLSHHWQTGQYLVGDRFTVADMTAAALLSPLALIPNYRQSYPWLFERITEIHHLCQEPLPPGLTSVLSRKF